MIRSENFTIQTPNDQSLKIADPITAAIIGAVTTLAAATMSETSAAMRGSSAAINQGAVIENRSSLTLTKWRVAEPAHGKWAFSPSDESPAMPSRQTAFDAWKMSGEAPEPVREVSDVDQLDDAAQGLLARWIRTDFTDPTTATFALNSIGLAGVEAVVVYLDQSADIAVAFYLDTPKVGTTQAGCMITREREIQRIAGSGDPTLKKLWKHIRNSNSPQTKLSRGDSKMVALDGFEISFNAAGETTFVLKGP